MHSEQFYLLVGECVRTPSGAMLPTRHVWGTVCAIEALDAKVRSPIRGNIDVLGVYYKVQIYIVLRSQHFST